MTWMVSRFSAIVEVSDAPLRIRQVLNFFARCTVFLAYESIAAISLITSWTRFSFADFLTMSNASLTPKTCFAATLTSSLGILRAVPSATRERKIASVSAVVSWTALTR